MKIIIPLAGLGSRFVQAGYSDPKPLIKIGDKTMVEKVIENLKPSGEHEFIFIANKAHKERLEPILEKYSKKIIWLSNVTQGAACTILWAADWIDEDELVIANSDQLVDIDINDFYKEGQKHDGLIMTFWADHPKWSYAKVDNGRVTQVAEKQVISNMATTGIYYFRNGLDFIKGATEMIIADKRVNGEFYVCPVFNELLEKDIAVYEIPADKMHGVGTPEDYEAYTKRMR
jgi:NDP-sugar pyrophosphorylase family protein